MRWRVDKTRAPALLPTEPAWYAHMASRINLKGVINMPRVDQFCSYCTLALLYMVVIWLMALTMDG